MEGPDTMPSRWQREYTCSLCASLVTCDYARIVVFNRRLGRTADLYYLCDDCLGRVREFLLRSTWSSLGLEAVS